MPNVAGMDVLEIFGLTSAKVLALNEREKERFDIAWDRMCSIFDTQGRQSLFDERDRNSVLLAAMMYKEFSGREFEGCNPKTGFGMRWALPQDVFSQTSDVLFDHNWATAGIRNWMSSQAVDAGTFAATGRIVNRDTTLQDHWTVLFLGLVCDHPSPKVKAFYIDINNDLQPIQHVEPNIRASEHHVAKFGHAYYVPPNTPYKTGLQFETGALGQDCVRPLAVVFVSATRALNLNYNASRPAAV